MTNLIDQTIAKIGLAPSYEEIDSHGNKYASFRRGHNEIARISIDHRDGTINVFVGLLYEDGELSYTDSGRYKTAHGAAQLLRRWKFTADAATTAA